MVDVEPFPPEVQDRIKEDIDRYGEWTTGYFLYLAPLWRMISELRSTDTDIVWFTTVLHMINFLSVKDPSPVHFVVAREVLSKKNITDNRAVDFLARELVTCYRKFQKFIISLCSDKEKGIAIPMQHDGGYLLPNRDHLPGVIFECNGCNMADCLFADFLQVCGETGKEAAKAVLADSRERYNCFKDSGFKDDYRPTAWDLWINKKEGNASVFSLHFSILADVVWKDICMQSWMREMKNVPALTQGVHPSVTKILSYKMEIKKKDGQLRLLHSQKVIGNLPAIDAGIPMIDPKLMEVIIKGAGSLNSIYHHKLIRFECRLGFENWIARKADIRLLKFERGCSEIAERLGFNNNRSIEEIKNILHAQAYLHFHFDDGSCGNLIVLNKFRASASGREDGIMITLGSQLLPDYTFKTSKRDRLLIPVPDLPPLISSSNSHASQATLQMLVMRELANQSIALSEVGSIEITNPMWQELAREAGLPASILKQILDCWTQDGDKGPRFLISLGGDRYSLGVAYQKEEAFLKDQGSLRKRRQKSAKKSVNLRKKKLGK